MVALPPYCIRPPTRVRCSAPVVGSGPVPATSPSARRGAYRRRRIVAIAVVNRLCASAGDSPWRGTGTPPPGSAGPPALFVDAEQATAAGGTRHPAAAAARLGGGAAETTGAGAPRGGARPGQDPAAGGTAPGALSRGPRLRKRGRDATGPAHPDRRLGGGALSRGGGGRRSLGAAKPSRGLGGAGVLGDVPAIGGGRESLRRAQG